MKPLFIRINSAIRDTLGYYDELTIKHYLSCLAGTQKYEAICKYQYKKFEETMKSFKRMEDEIHQTIYTTSHNTQVYLFENLKEWLQDIRIKALNKPLIIETLNNYNAKANAEFEDIALNKTLGFE
jgi:hypothetical protein